MAEAPFFFHDGALEEHTQIDLHEDTARHVVQVLRMQSGDRLILVNGKGYMAETIISEAHKRKCTVLLEHVTFKEQDGTRLHLGVSFTKNSNRNEWLLEKVTELGVSSIIPLATERSERNKFRYDRWENIVKAALIQSQQYYMPDLKELTKLEDVLQGFNEVPQKLVAHCIDDIGKQSIAAGLEKAKETIILIGPEGDFSIDEVNQLTSNGYKGISLGSTRLRTETAAVTACAYFNMANHD